MKIVFPLLLALAWLSPAIAETPLTFKIEPKLIGPAGEDLNPVVLVKEDQQASFHVAEQKGDKDWSGTHLEVTPLGIEGERVVLEVYWVLREDGKERSARYQTRNRLGESTSCQFGPEGDRRTLNMTVSLEE
jgi:hypothetical protein